MSELLTDLEHELLAQFGKTWILIVEVVGDGPTRDADLAEVAYHIHALQHFVMAQAAGRAYPTEYRLAGRTLPGSRP